MLLTLTPVLCVAGLPLVGNPSAPLTAPTIAWVGGQQAFLLGLFTSSDAAGVSVVNPKALLPSAFLLAACVTLILFPVLLKSLPILTNHHWVFSSLTRSQCWYVTLLVSPEPVWTASEESKSSLG